MKTIVQICENENSHFFSSCKYYRRPIILDNYNFLEEEYFIGDHANVYDYDESKKIVVKIMQGLEYKTRIIVRRPKNSNDFSGRVYLDILNATNGYDIEDLWRRSYLHILENNHIYVGITSKPINVLSLKNFDYDRYKDLNWSNGKLVSMPVSINPTTKSIEGTEEGLIWDMLFQLGKELKNKDRAILEDYKIKYLYLSGQSQSGVYLNTFINYMHNYYKSIGEEIPFDGYLSLASGGLNRRLNQLSNDKSPIPTMYGIESEVDKPTILFNSENDYSLFKVLGFDLRRTKNENTSRNKRRYYEMTAAPHTNSGSPLVPVNEEIVKTKCPPRLLDKDFTYRLNDLPFDYYVNGLIEKLHIWASKGIEPEIIEPIDFNNKDEFGHYLGGLRSPFIDIPKARYKAVYQVGSVDGTMDFFDQDELLEVYGSFENYRDRFKEYTEQQVKDGFLTERDAGRCLDWAKNISK